MSEAKDLIIVTGSSGKVGQVTVKKFSDPRFQVIGFDIIPPSFSQPNFEFMKVDLTSDESVNTAMNAILQKYGSQIAFFVHLASYHIFARGDWEKYEALTVQGTKRVLNACKAFDVGEFLFASSMLAHAPSAEHQKINECSELSLDWEYPKSKVLTEDFLREEHDKIPIVILRIASCYDDLCHSFPLAHQIQRIYEKRLESRIFPGDLTFGQAYVHLQDVALAIYQVFEKRSELPCDLTLLIGEEEVLSYGVLQRLISRFLFGKEFTTFRIPKWFAKVVLWSEKVLPFIKKTDIHPWMVDIADSHYELDISNAKKYLGFRPKHTLRQTLPIIIHALKADPRKWYKENELSWS